jgi:hypothetical protein
MEEDKVEQQEEPRPRPRNRKRERAIQDVMDNALNGGYNRLCKEITFQQAFSIHLRSRQLAEESGRPLLSDRELARQIDVCYAQRKQENG